MTNLIALKNIPGTIARRREADQRRRYHSPESAVTPLDAASYEIVVAEGCYGGAYAPTIGWCLTYEAASAVVAQTTRMPDGTSHRRMACQQLASG